METPGPEVKKPSLFRGGLIGYVATTLIGTIVYWFLAARSGHFNNHAALTLLVCFGTAGAFEGYRFMARRRKRLGVNEPSDEWQQFFGSWTFNFLAVIMLAGSFVISSAESLLFDLVYGAPWLQTR
jgi:hypothetical protein